MTAFSTQESGLPRFGPQPPGAFPRAHRRHRGSPFRVSLNFLPLASVSVELYELMKARILSTFAKSLALLMTLGAFTTAQLDAYGVKELHVLEDVLRKADRKVMAAVADRIRGKIGWTATEYEMDRSFLQAYYTALRGRLETRMLLGRRKRDKFDRD